MLRLKGSFQQFWPSSASVQTHRPSDTENVPPSKWRRSPSSVPAACNVNCYCYLRVKAVTENCHNKSIHMNLSSTAWWLSWQRATVSKIRSGSTPIAPSAWSSKCWSGGRKNFRLKFDWKYVQLYIVYLSGKTGWKLKIGNQGLEGQHLLNVFIFEFVFYGDVNIFTWKYIVSVSRARWRRRPAPKKGISNSIIEENMVCWIRLFGKRPSRNPMVIPPRRRSYSSIIPSMLFTFAI